MVGVLGADPSADVLRAELAEATRARLMAEEELRETLAAMIQHQQVGKCANFRYDTVTGEIWGTAAAFKMFCFPPDTYGCTREEWLEKIHPDDRARVYDLFGTIIANRDPMRFEYRILVGDGILKHVRCDGELDLEFDGNLTYFGVLTDITERNAAEEAQRATEAQLAAALRLASMGELAGSIIHEVNQPLAAITASAEACRRWLAAGPEKADRVAASLDRVTDEVQRAGAIMRGLKSLIQNDTAEPIAFDFEAATREVCSMLMAELARENVLLVTEFSPDLPSALGSQVQIQQIVMNLARNAIDAMRGISARRILTLSTTRSGDLISLRVTDTGSGIAGVDAERLFTPLYTTKTGGMGLGLAISRRIALAHGGALTAGPHPGGGALFELLLPAA